MNRLDQVAVCGTCGHVGYAGESHTCRPRYLTHEIFRST